jgi:integrase
MASCLAWNGSHINFEKEEIFVGQSLSGIKEDGSPIIEKPKTKSSRRFIPISAELVHQLRKWKLASPKSTWKLVFCQADGKPLHRKSTWNISNAAMRKADLEIIRVHDLRHTFATISSRPCPDCCGKRERRILSVSQKTTGSWGESDRGGIRLW